MTISSKTLVLVAEGNPGIAHAMNFREKRKAGKGRSLKTKKDAARQTISAVTKEMSKPRVAMSARTTLEAPMKN